jgi:hypothetical protein
VCRKVFFGIEAKESLDGKPFSGRQSKESVSKYCK